MFDIGWSEIAVIAVVALVAIGPKELPGTLYQMGKWARRARGLTREFQRHFDDMMQEAELDELRKQASSMRNFNLAREVEKTIDPTGALRDPLATPPASTEPPVQTSLAEIAEATPAVGAALAEPVLIPDPAAPEPDAPSTAAPSTAAMPAPTLPDAPGKTG